MTIAIICEYNPFHNGHAAQLAGVRKAYPDCRIVCIMSGCFTQRGEPAILPPYDRARMAVVGGADLVLELPQPWCSGSGEYFARGGVAIADALGVVDALAFGCETDDPTAPLRVAEQLDAPDFADQLTRLDPTEGAPARIARLYRERYGDDGGMLSRPNNRLAVEYCRALRGRKSTISPLPMQRKGSAYDSPTLDDANPSATAVRAALARDCALADLAPYLPQSTLEVIAEARSTARGPVAPDALTEAVLAHYRLADPIDLAQYASLGGGLASRLCAAAHEATTLDELLNLSATKVYTNTRIRRAILHGMLSVTEADLRADPTATLVLAANATGRAMLREIARTSTIPVIPKPADLAAHATDRELILRRRAEALYTLALPTPQPASSPVKAMPYFAD